ncbi:hypothetical protein SUGI_0911420 [Cryptomeria japonica]|nr:hypothetical protein SUGI_0911420 [Cryptomeria japonica]
MVLLYFFLVFASVAFAEEIKPGSILRPTDELWPSASGNFSMGFHSTANNDNEYVVGVSFGHIKELTLAWTMGALPVIDGAQLRFQSDGDLVLFNATNNVVWKSNTSNRGVTSAEMRDDGNFVLKNGSSAVVWETFENPTDTLLVGQKFSEGKHLIAALYSLSVESGGNMSLKWRNRIIYWNTSVSSVSSGGLGLSLSSRGILSLANSTGFGYWTARSSDYTDIKITVRRVTLDSDGNLRAYGWHEDSQTWEVGWSAVEDQCRVYGLCGDNGICIYYDTGSHCVCPSLDFVAVDPKNTRLGCRRLQDIASCPNNQTMVPVNHNEFLSYPPELKSVKYTLGMTDCWQNCLRDTSCTASTVLVDGSGTCLLITSNFTSGYSSLDILSNSYVKVCGPGHPASLLSIPSMKAQRPSKVSVVGIVVAFVGAVIAVVVFEAGVWWICCRNNPKFAGLSTQYTLLEYASGAPVQFSYKGLQQSTKNFRDKVGSGGFGTVYRGVLPNKTIVAVKKLEGIEQGEKQFRMEVATIGSTHHLNLVRLIGFCSERRHRLLVYEFLKNTSLDNFLFGSTEQSRKLDWKTRFHIALGTARGITYLHEECRDSIIHCDIKPENILLDENFMAKVSDFGLAKLINVKNHRDRTLSLVRGTRGYLAPEWLANLPITSKSDVFSYGMVLLELVSGKRNFDISATSGGRKFSTWAFEQFESGNVLSIVDGNLNGKFDMDQVIRVFQISFWCIQAQSSLRPPMSKIIQMLEGNLPTGKPPDPKFFGFQSESSINVSDTTMSVATTSTCPPSSSSSKHVMVTSNSEQNMSEIIFSGS